MSVPCDGANCKCLKAAQELINILRGVGLNALQISEKLPRCLVLPHVSAARLDALEDILKAEIAARIAATEAKDVKEKL